MPAIELAGQGAGGGGGVADDPRVGVQVATDGLRIEVDLDDHCIGPHQPAMAGRPHVQGGAERQQEVGAGHQLRRQRGREAAGDADRPRVAGKEPAGHRRCSKERAGCVGKLLDRLSCPSS